MTPYSVVMLQSSAREEGCTVEEFINDEENKNLIERIFNEMEQELYRKEVFLRLNLIPVDPVETVQAQFCILRYLEKLWKVYGFKPSKMIH